MFEAKDERRISDLLRKANGDRYREGALARQMAAAIRDAAKALRRARAAEDVNAHNVAAIFFARYGALGGRL
jgi:hypothetical protein